MGSFGRVARHFSVGVLLVGGLASAGVAHGAADDTSPPSESSQPGETVPPYAGGSDILDEAIEDGEIRIGTIVTPPWVTRAPDDSGYEGPEPLFMEMVAEAIGVDIEWVESSWETIIQGLEAEQFDIAAAPLNPTDERREVADFVEFTEAGYCYLVQDDAELQSVEDLNSPDVSISVGAGTALVGLMEEAFPDAERTSVALPPGANVNAEDILIGRYDVAIINSPEVYAYEDRFADELRVIPAGDECFTTPHLSTPIGVAIRKGDPVFVELIQNVYNANASAIDAEDQRATEALVLSD